MQDKIQEARSRLETLRTEVSELAESSELTEEQEARFDVALAEFDAASVEVEKLTERASKVEQIRTAPAVEEIRPASPEVHIKAERNVYDLWEARKAVSSPREFAGELMARSREAIETSDRRGFTSEQREAATDLVERTGNPEIAQHILETGSPEYHDAFLSYLGGDTRTAMSLTAANGGVLVPFTLDPTIILTNAGSTNPIRQISNVVSITTDDWNGVSSAGVTAEWLAEGNQAADATPTFAQETITTAKAAAYLFASIEVTQDSNIETQLGRLFADAKDNLEAAAFVTGTGSGQPVGIQTALNLTTTSRVAGSSGAAGAADPVAADVYALDNDLGPRFRPNASFVAAKKTYNALRQLGTTSYHSWWVDFGGALPSKLIGYPTYEASAMDSTIVSGSNDDVLILGDFRYGYTIVDRVGMSIAYNPLVVGAQARPTGQVGWFAFWRTGADSVADAAFRMLRL